MSDAKTKNKGAIKGGMLGPTSSDGERPLMCYDSAILSYFGPDGPWINRRHGDGKTR